MASVLIPQKGAGMGAAASQILPAIGSFFGPVGSLVGNVVGGVAGASAKSDAQKADMIAKAPQEGAGQSAEQRRASNIDPDETIKAAYIALNNAPKELQDQYREPLEEAMRMARAGKTGAI